MIGDWAGSALSATGAAAGSLAYSYSSGEKTDAAGDRPTRLISAEPLAAGIRLPFTVFKEYMTALDAVCQPNE